MLSVLSGIVRDMENNNQDLSGIQAITEHARWIAERTERINEALAQLAGIFIGFLGVELAIIGQFVFSKYDQDFSVLNKFGLTTTVVLLAAGLCFFIRLEFAIEFTYTELSDLQKTREMSNEEQIKQPYEWMVSTDVLNKNIISSLDKENEFLAKHYKRGTWASIAGQVVLALVLIGNVIW